MQLKYTPPPKPAGELELTVTFKGAQVLALYLTACQRGCMLLDVKDLAELSNLLSEALNTHSEGKASLPSRHIIQGLDHQKIRWLAEELSGAMGVKV